MTEATVLTTGGDVDALALAEAYAKLLAAGDTGELVVRLVVPPSRIDLVPDGGDWYAVPFAVTVEAQPGTVLDSVLPIRVVGREVQLRGLQLPNLPPESVQLVARDRVLLDGCRLTAVPGGVRRGTGSVSVRVSRPDASPRVEVRGCVLTSRAPGTVTIGVRTPGPTLVLVDVDGCDLGEGLQLVAEGAERVALRGSRCTDPSASVHCAPGTVAVEQPGPARAGPASTRDQG